MGTNPVPAVGPIANVIPPFSSSGVLPPYVGTDPTIAANVSPYRVTLVELVRRFALNSDRKAILAGFLAHRANLIQLGVTGIQWIDGSFLEDVETIESRTPNDIDVISFIVRPPTYQADNVAWERFWKTHLTLFHAPQAKAAFRTDAYFVDVAFGPGQVIRQTAYWFGLFSHKRATGLWKGMLEIELDAAQDDVAAAQLLATLR